ncbi:uncharacterized protein LOC142518338 [Primulina tabacum]|uniref:uncharacterized protein LOC142518338 n=1 Tax=Primulina tabacum TaxID=48773 RepID=UPI003F5A348A
MRMYIKSIEEREWQRVLDSWSPPRTVDDDGDSRVKPRVHDLMMNPITNCISAKEAWDILQKHCEGSESVRRTNLRKLTSKFESLRMEENETIVEYDRRLCDIANEDFSIGDPMSNERLDTSTLNMEDLISSLQTFEMNLDLQKRNKENTIALQSTDYSMNNLIQDANESDLGEESISLITKKFDDYLKRMRDKKKIVSTPKPSFVPFERNKMSAPTQGNIRSINEVLGRTETKKLDSVQCRECSGFGHYANEYANRLCRNKNMAVSLSDEDTDEERDSKEGDDCTSLSIIQNDIYKLHVNPFGVATGVATPGRNTVPKSLCLNAKSLENSDVDKIQESDQEELTLEIVQMMKDFELCKVKDDLEKASKTLAKFNSNSSKLDSMLTIGKDSRSGLGYVESIYEHGESSNSSSKTTVFVKSVEDCAEPLTNPPMKTVQSSKLVSEQKLKISSSSSSSTKSHSSTKVPQVKKPGAWYFDSGCSRHITCSKEHLIDYIEVKGGRVTYGGGAKCRIVGKGTLNVDGLPELHNVLHVEGLNLNLIIISQLCAWYFDSGCSRHITCSKEHLIDYIEVKGGRVTYGGGAKCRIVGKGTLNVDGLPELHNVLHVEGLNLNLIIISQLCDDDLHVRFNKNNCEVFNDANICILSGTRSADNCYLLGEGDDCRSAKEIHISVDLVRKANKPVLHIQCCNTSGQHDVLNYYTWI